MSGKTAKKERAELAEAAARSADEINAEYTKVCTEVGSLEIQAENIKFKKQQLFMKISELSKEMDARMSFDEKLKAELEKASQPKAEANTSAPEATV